MSELRKYGVGTTFYFPLITYGSTDFDENRDPSGTSSARISKNGKPFQDAENLIGYVDEGIYEIDLTATEMEAAVIMIVIKDDINSPKLWEDQAININTYGNASAEHAFDLDSTAIDSGVNVIQSDLVVLDAVVYNIYSDTTIILSDLTYGVNVVTVLGDDPMTAADVIPQSDIDTITSDIALVYSDTTAISSGVNIIQSDIKIIDENVDTVASDVIVIMSDTGNIYSDTTVITSDVKVIDTNVDDIIGILSNEPSTTESITELLADLSSQNSDIIADVSDLSEQNTSEFTILQSDIAAIGTGGGTATLENQDEIIGLISNEPSTTESITELLDDMSTVNDSEFTTIKSDIAAIGTGGGTATLENQLLIIAQADSDLIVLQSDIAAGGSAPSLDD